MVTVSSAFMSSRRERIIFSVLSASGCAFKAAALVDVLRVVFTAGSALGTFASETLALATLALETLALATLALETLALATLALETLGKTDLDNTDVARDHSFHCI